MKNIILGFLSCFALVALLFTNCKNEKPAPAAEAPTANIEEKILLDTFADLQILRYELPGFDELDLRQKTLIYYLSEATLSGRDINYDQLFKHNLLVRKTLEGIFTGYKGAKSGADWAAFELWAKRVWFSNGIHHHYSETKLPVTFTEAYLATLINETPAELLPKPAAELIAQLNPIIFDPSVAAKRTNKDDGIDIVQGSSVNFYEGVTQEEVDAFYGKLLDKAGKKPPLVGLNSKLVKENGKLVEKTWKIGGMYGAALEKVVFWLEKAKTVAENDKQVKAIDLLIKYYKTGDLKDFDAYNIAWVEDTEGKIDFINGFIEVYHDPKGFKADWEACVQYNDPEATKKMAIVSKNAQYFEDNSSIAPEHKKANVKGVSYRVINVAMEGGDCSPSTPIGINLPNSNWIREDYGSKSISLNNIEEAYGKSGGALATAEFAHDAEEAELSKKYASAAGKMHTALHEVIGHASGKLNPGVKEPNITLKNYSSTLEEARADLVALYFMPDPKLIEFGLMPAPDAFKAEYDGYIRNGLVQQLRRLKPGDNIEEDHMRNRQLVAAWAFEKGKVDKVIERVERDGKVFYDIKDYAKLQVLFGQLLKEIQRIKSEGDFPAAKALVETYGVKADPELVKQVQARYSSLNTKAYSGFVQPKLVPVVDAAGAITDIKVELELNFVEQMLRYGREYSFLGINN